MTFALVALGAAIAVSVELLEALAIVLALVMNAQRSRTVTRVEDRRYDDRPPR